MNVRQSFAFVLLQDDIHLDPGSRAFTAATDVGLLITAVQRSYVDDCFISHADR